MFELMSIGLVSDIFLQKCALKRPAGRTTIAPTIAAGANCNYQLVYEALLCRGYHAGRLAGAYQPAPIGGVAGVRLLLLLLQVAAKVGGCPHKALCGQAPLHGGGSDFFHCYHF